MPYQQTNPERIEAVSTVFASGKTQVPATIRRLLNITDGDKIVWITREQLLIVKKA